MGSKSEAKKIMEKAAVPLVPGYHGDDQSPELLGAGGPKRIGFPVLIKASAGGGGKGMRVVEEAARSSPMPLAGAKREARKASFADDHVLIEKVPDAAAPHRDPGLRRHATATASTFSSATARSSAAIRR